MKTIIASLKAQIEAIKKSIDTHEIAKRELWNDVQNAGKHGASDETIETLVKCEEEARVELMNEERKLDYLRSALTSVRMANGEDFHDIDCFAPETTC